MDMKLNKYIIKKLNETWPSEGIPTEEDMEDWITDWYNDTFKDIDNEDKPRGPPMWLAGSRWYDRRRRKIAEAKAEEEEAQRRALASTKEKDEA
tara:strand:+ start:2413 stop:2694 length:282 start_codon:yes stop_codon:yes gene_type:complete